MSEKATIQTIDRKYIMERQGRDAVLYAGLLDCAHRSGIRSIRVQLVQAPAEANGMTAICHATVEMEDGRIHEDIGDANPQNVGRAIAPHIIRMAATRAKARALRDALNIGGVSLEELGPEDEGDAPQRPAMRTVNRQTGEITEAAAPRQLSDEEKARRKAAVEAEWTAARDALLARDPGAVIPARARTLPEARAQAAEFRAVAAALEASAVDGPEGTPF